MPQLSDIVRRNLRVLLVVLLLVLVCVICIFSPTIVASISIQGPSVPVATIAPTKVSQVTTTPSGELIGISDGTSVLDTRETNRKYKLDAADKLKAGDSTKASQLWEQARQADSTDAETLIYLENQRVLDSHKPYITVIVATILSGPNSGIGSSNLQGSYVAQKEYNECSDTIQKENTQCPGLGPNWYVRLLIANSGSRKEDAALVAKQIIQLSKAERTFVGVMGWPLSDQTLQALDVLKPTNIPMVSSASSDDLTGNAPHFFRVSVPASKQAAVAADYAEQTLKAKNVWIFTDEHNSYSRSLAQNFSKEFEHGDNQIYPANYTVGDEGSVIDALANMRSNPPPDLIYFAGYASDVNPLLERLPNKDLLVLGPNSLYELGGYQDKSFIPRIRLTAFAYPDEWGILGYGAQTPKFFDNYRSYFDPNNIHPGQYGYSRTDADVMLAYDATKVILTASGKFLAAGNPNVTPKDLQDALEQITGNQAFQGVSGQISFDSSGNAMNKELLILCTTPERDGTGRFHLAQAQGQFLVGNLDQSPLPSFTTDCR